MKTTEKMIIEQFADPPAGLILSEKAFRLQIPAGESRRCSVEVRAVDSSRIQGQAVSLNRRIIPARDSFEGEVIELVFGLDTKGLRAGDSFEDLLILITSQGEVRLPVSVEVKERLSDNFGAEVGNLEAFGRVCEKSMRQGFRLFTDPDFPRILNGKNRPLLALYKGMSQNPVTYQHMEEFLVAVGRKNAVEISLDKTEKGVYHLEESQKDTLYLYKNTWGYLHLDIEVEGDFLEVEKQSITAEDFIGRVCGLEYVVNADKLSRVRSRGRIIIRSLHQTLVYEVEASLQSDREFLPGTRRRRQISWLLRDLLALHAHRLDYRSWQETSAMTVREFEEEDPEDAWILMYDAYLCLAREDRAEAIQKLWPIKTGDVTLRGDEQKGFYLYLAKQAELLPAERSEITAKLMRYCQRNPQSWILLYLIGEESVGEHTPADRLADLERCFDAGASSPFLYLMAWELIVNEEALLRRMTPFMIQVLRFGQKEGRLTESLLLRAAFLSDSQRWCSGALYRLFERGYDAYPDDAVLEAIVKLILKGDPLRPEYHRWYALAVERDLRITRLFEYFMETYSGSSDGELPLAVQMYFAYTQGTLGEKKRALLYASVILHKDVHPTIYDNYEPAMRRFAREGLFRLRLDENYAVLYREFCIEDMTYETAECLARLIFCRKLEVKDTRVRQVIVTHTGMKAEEVCPVRDGMAWPALYSEDACILFEDEKKRRWLADCEVDAIRLFDERELVHRCLNAGVIRPSMLLYLCKEKAFQMDVNSRSLSLYQMAAQEAAFTGDYRRVVRRKLVEWYLLHRDEDDLMECFLELDAAKYARADKVGCVQLLVKAGRLEDAFSLISAYGHEGVPLDCLLRLAEGMIAVVDGKKEEELICLAAYLLGRDKSDRRLMEYLIHHQSGTTGDLCRLWEKGRSMGLAVGDLEERLLQQSMAVRVLPAHISALLSSYMDRMGCTDTAKFFLTWLAVSYYPQGRDLPPEVFSLMGDLILKGEELSLACKIAILYFYAETAVIEDKEKRLVKKCLSDASRSGVHLDFFQKLPAILTQTYQIDDKVFVQETFKRDARVVLHYCLTEPDGSVTGWVSEPVRNVYLGIFVREFLLFYGETMTYYFSVMEDGRVRKTDTYELSVSGMNTEGETRYKLLNQMLEAEAEADWERQRQAADQYLYRESYVDSLLEMIL